MRKKHKAEQRVQKKKQTDRKSYLQRRELRNKGRESLEVSPQALDHSKREPLEDASMKETRRTSMPTLQSTN